MRTSTRRRTLARTLALLAFLGVAVVIWFLVELFQPFTGSGTGRVIVDIPQGAGTSQIGGILARDGVVSSGFFFKLRAKLDGDVGKLLPGRHVMAHGMSYSSALQVLITPPKAAPTTNVTVVPGHSRGQVAALLHAQHVKGSYLALTRRSRYLNPAAYGAPRSIPSLEGFLFPDTYQLRLPVSAAALVQDQLTTFKQQFAHVNLSYARSKNLTPYDVLIIASMVEAEAATQHDRPLVASVIYNRLAQHIPLGIDATIRYAVNNYTTPLTLSQLASPSPYNTRTHDGLPPTPIDSPSMASIQAAAHPAQTNYLYFVVKPCGNGEMSFTSSYSQFLADSAAYQNARARLGGRSPEKCPKG
ncbi:MAG TPA: endolytic transglycosylase MltG [Solirubrobacteraceae bacterium]|nr:endolytic transglycosylase MltG [Solirubrobacteraceae bacterium]